MQISGLSNIYLKQISQAISFIFQNILRLATEISQVYLKQISDIYENKCWSYLKKTLMLISGKYSTYLRKRHTLNISWVNLRPISGISQAFMHIYLQSSYFSIVSVVQSCTCLLPFI